MRLLGPKFNALWKNFSKCVVTALPTPPAVKTFMIFIELGKWNRFFYNFIKLCNTVHLYSPFVIYIQWIFKYCLCIFIIIAIQSTFPDVTILGCCFHWIRAIWRRIQDLGLASTYVKREAMHRYIKQLIALPFLPTTFPSSVRTGQHGRAHSPSGLYGPPVDTEPSVPTFCLVCLTPASADQQRCRR